MRPSVKGTVELAVALIPEEQLSASPTCAGKYGVLGVLRTLGVSYFCNLLGALMLMGLMSAGEVFTGRWVWATTWGGGVGSGKAAEVR